MQYDSVQLLKTDRWRFLCPTKFNRIRGRRTTAQADSILTQPGSRFELRLVRLDYPNIWGTRLEHFRNLECKLVTTRSQLPYVQTGGRNPEQGSACQVFTREAIIDPPAASDARW